MMLLADNMGHARNALNTQNELARNPVNAAKQTDTNINMESVPSAPAAR